MFTYSPPDWIAVAWDGGGHNSYRMGAKGMFDLSLAASHDTEKLRRDSCSSRGEVGGAVGGAKVAEGIKGFTSNSAAHPFGIGEIDLNVLIFFIHNKNAASEKRYAQVGKLLPYDRGYPIKVLCGAHTGNFSTNPVK